MSLTELNPLERSPISKRDANYIRCWVISHLMLESAHSTPREGLMKLFDHFVSEKPGTGLGVVTQTMRKKSNDQWCTFQEAGHCHPRLADDSETGSHL